MSDESSGLREALEKGMKAAEKRTGMHLIAHYYPYLDELEKAVAPLLAAHPTAPQPAGERVSSIPPSRADSMATAPDSLEQIATDLRTARISGPYKPLREALNWIADRIEAVAIEEIRCEFAQGHAGPHSYIQAATPSSEGREKE